MTRIAYICPHKECDPPRRIFLDAEPDRPPKCSDHTTTAMVRQPNVSHVPGSGSRPRRVRAPRRPANA